MARAFEITAAANRVQLGSDRKAQTAFTVSNVLGRPMRGRVRVVPEGGADPGWFTVAGPENRDFAAGATDQVRVDLAVPAGVDAGDYPFRLDVIAEENPDELSARGQSVHLQVPASEAEKKPFPWWIVAVAAGVLVVAAVGIWLATRDGGGEPKPATAEAQPAGVEVPDLDRYTARGAQQRLEEEGFVVTLEPVLETEAEPGTVLGREPADDVLDEGAAVTLLVAAPRVPDVAEADLAQARTRLEREGLGLSNVWEVAGTPGGVVAAQDPESGERVRPGDGVGVLLAVNDPYVKSSAQLSLESNRTVDVDAGQLGSVADDDLLFRERDGRMVMEPRNQATLAVVEGDALMDFNTCRRQDMNRRPVDLERLRVGHQLCLKTSENRYARLRLAEQVRPGSPLLQLQYTTWMRPNERPTSPPSKRPDFKQLGLQVRPEVHQMLRNLYDNPTVSLPPGITPHEVQGNQ